MVNTGSNHPRRRTRWVLLVAALGFSSYGAYRVYKLPSVVKKRERTMRFFGALASIAELLGDSAEAAGVVSRDLKEFVQSDSDQIPNSLRQVFKIMKSDEFSESIVRVSRAFTVGILRGYRVEARKGDSGTGFSDRALDKLFSPAGSGFASVVVGSFAKNMVMAIYADINRSKNSGDSVHTWVDVITDENFKKLIGDCIQRFVSTLVSVYLDKTIDINPYNEILAGLTNPKHEDKVRDLLALVCNGAIETFVRTSHQVLTNSNPNGNSNSSSSYFLKKGSSTISKVLDGKELMLSKLKPRNGGVDGWASKMSSTLAVPGNLRFVLDVTGRVTLVTIKSFLVFSVNQLSEGMKRSAGKVGDKGHEVYRYLTTRSLVVTTICVSLYLHTLSGSWSLMPP